MKLYFSGIGGVGLAPLALIAIDCGFEVFGSDRNPSLSSAELEKRGIEVTFEQSFEEIQTAYNKNKFDWLVVTAALPQNHPHLQFAKENNIRISKRDELLNYILEQKKLKLIAVAGTHGKTTTTAMVTWLFKQNNIPVSYLIGSNISFGPAGKYEKGSKYFVLECDEFDKNFLHFNPEISLITSLDYDHPDSYPTKQDYLDSFQQFLNQTKNNICIWNEDFQKLNLKDITAKVHNFKPEEKPNSEYLKLIKLAGLHNRKNGFLAISATSLALSETLSDNTVVNKVDSAKLNNSLSTFPGTERRFEKLRNGLYSDYAHHPVEIAATIQLAKEVQEMGNFNKLVIIYQPHQNLRQHDKTIQQGYKSCFNFTDKLYWLPTYLSRENKDLEILTPIMLAENLEGFRIGKSHLFEVNSNLENLNGGLDEENNFIANNYSGELFGEFVEFNDHLKNLIQTELDNNNLVVCFGAGNIDEFVRKNFSKN